MKPSLEFWVIIEKQTMQIQLSLIVVTLTIFDTFLLGCNGYRILGIFPLNGRSHMMMFEQLMKGLARRGHQVDVVSTFPQKKPYPNYTDIIIPSAMPAIINNVSYDRLQEFEKTNIVRYMAVDMGNDLCEKGLTYPAIQKLIKNPPTDPPYDLVVTQIFSAHCYMIFGHHLKVPVIGLSTSVPYPWGNDFGANPENLAFVPNTLLAYMENMNFLNRLYNVVHNIYIKMYYNYYTAAQSEFIKRHFGPDSPDIRQLERDLALILTNSHMSLNGVKSTTPALVEVGGLHIQDDDSEIPTEHKKWLDESKDGFIYFTFGSMITVESFPKSILLNMYKSFRKIAPMRVFMKVPHPEMLPAGLPKNVRTFLWIPQLKTLKHKNIKAFITHGGLMGTQEAIFCAVPMIGMPLFADQFLNIDLYVKKKIAIRLDYRDLTEEKLDTALNEILYNPVYRKNVKDISNVFLDRPRSPMDEACYWIEYVIRHGSKALRSPALDFSWWQIELLDVYLTLIVTAIVALFIMICLLRFIINTPHEKSLDISHSKKIN